MYDKTKALAYAGDALKAVSLLKKLDGQLATTRQQARTFNALAVDSRNPFSGITDKKQRRAMALDMYRRGFIGDAAGASAMAFLNSALELVDTELVTPIQEAYHARDINVKVGGGYPEYISAYGSNYMGSGNQGLGLQGTNNTEVPMAQIDVQKETWPVFIWASGFLITYADLQRFNTQAKSGIPAPYSLQELYDDSVKTIWLKALDGLTYAGFEGYPGLLNNPNIPAFVAANGGTSTTWASKNPTQILADINQALEAAVANSGYSFKEGCPTNMLVPLYPQWGVLTQPMTIAGAGLAQSTLDYILKENIAAKAGIDFKIDYLPNPWISGQGLGNSANPGVQGNGLDRGVLYRKSTKSQYVHIPQPMTKVMVTPSAERGGSYNTLFQGTMAAPIFKRTITSMYVDGI